MAHNKIEVGCIVDHGRDTAENTMVAVIDYAIEQGYTTDFDYKEAARQAQEDYTNDGRLSSHFEKLVDEEDTAIDWLNECIADGDDLTPPFAYFSNDGEVGAFGLWIDSETATLEQPNVDSLPEYAVEVNDHGNVTLYQLKLVPIWSVV